MGVLAALLGVKRRVGVVWGGAWMRMQGERAVWWNCAVELVVVAKSCKTISSKNNFK